MSERTTSAADLHALFNDEWEAHLAADPFFATITGDRRYNDRLPEASEARYAREAEALRGFLDRLRQIDREDLSEADRLNYDIFRRLKQDALAEIEFRSYLAPIDRMGGFHTSLGELGNLVRFDRAKDYQDYLARLDGFAAHCAGQIGLMREGLRRGFTQFPFVPTVGLEVEF